MVKRSRKTRWWRCAVLAMAVWGNVIAAAAGGAEGLKKEFQVSPPREAPVDTVNCTKPVCDGGMRVVSLA
ncbi:MAG: hypothetical protein AB7G93_12860 [Bdellovibrionales bacterium]